MAGTGFVGLRCPNHKIALELIKASQVPIAAPSANKFGHISPTKANHVFNDFVDNNVLIIDGGNCSVGIESSVIKILKLSNDEFEIKILRKGIVSEAGLKKVISESQLLSQYKINITTRKIGGIKMDSKEAQIAPGFFIKHYSPNIDTFLLNRTNSLIKENKKQIMFNDCVLIDFGGMFESIKSKLFKYYDCSPCKDVFEAINNLYDQLHLAEKEKCNLILINNFYLNKVEGLKNEEHLDAIYERIFRSAGGKFAEMYEDGTVFI